MMGLFLAFWHFQCLPVQGFQGLAFLFPFLSAVAHQRCSYLCSEVQQVSLLSFWYSVLCWQSTVQTPCVDDTGFQKPEKDSHIAVLCSMMKTVECLKHVKQVYTTHASIIYFHNCWPLDIYIFSFFVAPSLNWLYRRCECIVWCKLDHFFIKPSNCSQTWIKVYCTIISPSSFLLQVILRLQLAALHSVLSKGSNSQHSPFFWSYQQWHTGEVVVQKDFIILMLREIWAHSDDNITRAEPNAL